MNLLWDLYWPLITAALIIGVIAGAVAFRRRKRSPALAAGLGAVLILGWAWYDPAGAGEKFASSVERQTRQVLIDFEMAQVSARIERDPLRRTLVLSGPADDFQRGELVRILDEVPGVLNVHWSNSPARSALPILLEVELAALVSFGLGLLLSYLLELRRRFNAQWRW
jgi:hypothetical protein